MGDGRVATIIATAPALLLCDGKITIFARGALYYKAIIPVCYLI